MRIPSKQKCFELICEMEMMDHIVAHSILVCRVALLLVNRLTSAGETLNRELVQASALLHDITKTRSFKTGEIHSETGCQLLSGKGFPEIGDIVRQHVTLDAYFPSDAVTETEIVNYADKRVLHDRVVSLDDRMDYILERYGKTDAIREKIMQLWEKSKEMETRIFKDLPVQPRDVENIIGRDGYTADMAAYRKICAETKRVRS